MTLVSAGGDRMRSSAVAVGEEMSDDSSKLGFIGLNLLSAPPRESREDAGLPGAPLGASSSGGEETFERKLCFGRGRSVPVVKAGRLLESTTCGGIKAEESLTPVKRSTGSFGDKAGGGGDLYAAEAPEEDEFLPSIRVLEGGRLIESDRGGGPAAAAADCVVVDWARRSWGGGSQSSRRCGDVWEALCTSLRVVEAVVEGGEKKGWEVGGAGEVTEGTKSSRKEEVGGVRAGVGRGGRTGACGCSFFPAIPDGAKESSNPLLALPSGFAAASAFVGRPRRIGDTLTAVEERERGGPAVTSGARVRSVSK
jgi:hypothetical protein